MGSPWIGLLRGRGRHSHRLRPRVDDAGTPPPYSNDRGDSLTRFIAAVLFDFGGVLTTSPFEAFERYEIDNELEPGFIRRVNSTSPDDNAWARLERNEVTLGEFDHLFGEESAAHGARIPGADVLQLLSGDPRPKMIEAARRCGERLTTGLLTNNIVAVEDDPPSALAEILAIFDAVIESSKVGVRKPDPTFYEVACERLDIEPEEAVFLDDLGINLKPARAMGMQTIKVQDPAVAIADLEAVVGFRLGD
jgi:putative hydrolase of the HAD superfamily